MAGGKFNVFAMLNFVSFCFCIAYKPAFRSRDLRTGVRLFPEKPVNGNQELVKKKKQKKKTWPGAHHQCFKGSVAVPRAVGLVESSSSERREHSRMIF